MKQAIMVLILTSLLAPSIRSAQDPIYMGISPLLATPERFNGHLVCVIGYLSVSNEGDMLYMHRDDYENQILTNAVKLHLKTDAARMAKELALNYVRVVGVFASKGVGHGIPDGTLSDISSVSLWSDPKHPRVEMKQPWNPQPDK
ncbi:MAG: hypothetical protein ACRD5R_19300 [Candidatus Acidiferrales bacterium]